MDFDALWNDNEEPKPATTTSDEVTDEQKLVDAKSRYKLLCDMLSIYFHVKHGEPRKYNIVEFKIK